MELLFMVLGLLVLAMLSLVFGTDSRNIEEALRDASAPHAQI